MFEKILVPIDESNLSHRILGVVQRLVRSNPDARLHLVRVLTPADSELTATSDPTSDARAHLDHVVELVAQVGLRVSSSLLVGDPASRIIEAADELQPSLIAMASHGDSGIPRWIRGSVAERVLEGARFPLLVANPISLPDEPVWSGAAGSLELHRATDWKKILVPFDGSGSAASILPLVRDVAHAYDSDVTLLHVRRRGDAPSLDSFAQRLEGVHVQTVVAEGNPACVILDYASDQGVDLIALTTHGHSKLSRWAFGSVAGHVLAHAATPVLVKRTAGFVSRPHAFVLPTE